MTIYYQNPYLPHSLRGAASPPAQAKKNAAPITVDAEGLPIGTAAQVMAWVDDNPRRAQAFLTKEQRESRPRVSLVANLKAVLKRHEVAPVDIAPPAVEAPVAIESEDVTEEESVDQLTLIRQRLMAGGS